MVMFISCVEKGPFVLERDPFYDSFAQKSPSVSINVWYPIQDGVQRIQDGDQMVSMLIFP